MKRWAITLTASALMLVSLLAQIPTVGAADEPQFGIRPATPGADPTTSGYFTIKAQSGETVKDALIVANPGTVPVKVLLYPVDATTGQGGGAVYMSSADPRKNVGSWIKLENAEVTVPPQKQTTVNFTIDVPAGVPVGQHLGGIAAQLDRGTPSATQGQTSFGVTTITRAVSAVLVNIGDIAAATPSLRINGAQVSDVDGLLTLTLAVQNDSGVLVKSKGEVTMTDAAGKTVLTNQITLDTIVPGTTINYPVQAEPPALPGTYRVRATLDFGGGAHAVFEGPVTVSIRPTATPIVGAPAGRVRPTAPAGVVAPTVAAAESKGGSSPLVLILGVIIGGFAIVSIGLVTMLARSRKRAQR